MAPGANTHLQIQQRLPMYGLGLLSESEEATCRQHLETCEACRAALEFIDDSDDVEAGDPQAITDDLIHIPDAILARWPAESARLQGAERALYREHLSSCATCAGALRVLGHAQALPIVPELESAAPPWLGIAKDPEPDLQIAERQPQPQARRSRVMTGRFRGRILGVLASAAAVIASVALNPQLFWRLANQPVIASRPPTEGPSPVTPPVETPPVAAGKTPQEPLASTRGSIQIIAMGRSEAIPELLASRGSSGSTDLFTMTADDSLRGRVTASTADGLAARLEIPAALEGAASDATIRAELLGPNETIVAGDSFRVAELFPRKTLLVRLEKDARSGIYTLRLLSPGAGAGDEPDTLVAHYFIRPVHS